MMCAALLGHEVAGTPADAVSRIVALVRRIGPLPEWPKVEAAKILQAMYSDKKARAGKLRFVLTPRIGHAETVEDVPEKTVNCILRWAPHFFGKPPDSLGNCDG
jgi:3-dehydroquinate synthase